MQTNTRNVWPWSLLVPVLEQEIWRRLPAATKVSSSSEGRSARRSKAIAEAFSLHDALMPIEGFSVF